MAATSWFFSRPSLVFTAAILFRVALLIYGHWQDANSAVKYTDIDYMVFTDAARFVSHGRSPYDRATYRYTPLLAWLLYPTTWGGVWFEFGKVLFAAGDVVTGWLIMRILREYRGMDEERAAKYASIWLLSPMVANISTRGSSEGLVAVIVIALLLATLQKRAGLAGVLLGLGVQLKIYPFIYATSIFWWFGPDLTMSSRLTKKDVSFSKIGQRVSGFFTPARRRLAVTSFVVFTALNVSMLYAYGRPFLEQTFLYHLTRTDHRHNFSLYNTVLHLNSARMRPAAILRVESLAFIPQLGLSVVLIPVLLAKKDLAGAMLAQTFAFVTFNKVCTSQYFLWYMVFLPFYLPESSLLQDWGRGLLLLGLWIAGQAVWLEQGYELEFLGRSTFVPGLWLASLVFFAVNCRLLGIIIRDAGSRPQSSNVRSSRRVAEKR